MKRFGMRFVVVLSLSIALSGASYAEEAGRQQFSEGLLQAGKNL